MNTIGAIVVTGSSRGIGAAVSVELARRGFQVGCLSRSGDLPAGAEALGSDRDRLINLRCDVTRPSEVSAALASLADGADGIQGLVNNAGIVARGRSESFSEEEFASVLATNVTALFSVARLCYPYLEPRDASTIINVGSFWERLGVAQFTAYCASKAAVGAITRCLAVEWAARGIRVLDVAPGYIETDFNREALAHPRFREFLDQRIPLRRPGQTDEIARFVGTLFSEPVPFLTGETIVIDGGQSIAQ